MTKSNLKNKAQNHLSHFSNKKIIFDCQPLSQALVSLEDRRRFRRFLIEKIKSRKEYKKHNWNLSGLLKTGVRPKHPFVAASISHCPSFAGFVFAFRESSTEKKNVSLNPHLSIGLDIEETQRVSQKVILHVSQTKELNESPRVDFLWTAKESSFKCFSDDLKSPLLIKECLISDWEPLSANKAYTFKAQYKKKQAKGLAFSIEHLSFAYTEKTV